MTEKYRCDLHTNASDILPCPWPGCLNGARVVGEQFRPSVAVADDPLPDDRPARDGHYYHRRLEFFRLGTHQYGVWVWVLEK